MHFRGPVAVVSAAAGLAVEEPAADLGEIGAGAVVGVLELDQAALAASVTDALPFGFRHFLQRLALPERNFVMRHLLAYLKIPGNDRKTLPAHCSFTSPCGYCAIVRPDLIG